MITLKSLLENQEISVRTFNACGGSDIHTIEDVANFYLKKKSFKYIRNCGEKSIKELEEIYHTYKDISVLKVVSTVELEIEIYKTVSLVNKLTRLQREVVNSYIKSCTGSLKARANNALHLFLENNFSVKNFSKAGLLDNFFDFYEIKNIGKTTV